MGLSERIEVNTLKIVRKKIGWERRLGVYTAVWRHHCPVRMAWVPGGTSLLWCYTKCPLFVLCNDSFVTIVVGPWYILDGLVINHGHSMRIFPTQLSMGFQLTNRTQLYLPLRQVLFKISAMGSSVINWAYYPCLMPICNLIGSNSKFTSISMDLTVGFLTWKN